MSSYATTLGDATQTCEHLGGTLTSIEDYQTSNTIINLLYAKKFFYFLFLCQIHLKQLNIDYCGQLF